MSDAHPDADADSTVLGRRYVALLFADLSQSTELAGALEAEHYAQLLAALRRAYQDIIPAHGGLVVRVGSRMFDSSLKTKLANLKVVLKGTG